MTSSLTGAMDARRVIMKFHISLNKADLVPQQCYQRDHMTYTMILYVNQIIALFLSSNYEVIPIFIRRTVVELERNVDQPQTENYRKIVHDYLCQVTFYLVNYTATNIDIIRNVVPKRIYSGGPKPAPEFDHKTLLFKSTST
jgi:hypothetical protein